MKCQVKLFAKNEVDRHEFDKLIPVFHTWIRTKKINDELLIDVADYTHVPQGPGVVLIGHQSDYYLDEADDQVGLLYSRKRGLEGSNEAIVEDAMQRALKAATDIEAEPTLSVSFDRSRAVVRFLDRASLPNSEVGYAAIADHVAAAAARAFGAKATVERIPNEPREPLSVRVTLG